MNCTLILNGCSDSYEARAEEMRGFISQKMEGLKVDGGIILCRDLNERDRLIAAAPTRRVVLVQVGRYQPETALKVLPEFCRDADLILCPGDYFGAEMAVRLGCRLGGASLVSALSVKLSQGRLVGEKMVYGHHLKAAFELRARPCCLALAKGGPEKPEGPRPKPEEVLEFNRSGVGGAEFIVESDFEKEAEPGGLAGARRLVVGGYGVGSRAGLDRLERLARTLGAEFGVTRPAAMNAWAPLNKLVGVSGALTGPDWCLTFGVSGAAAFYAGIEKSKFIVAVNHDPKAPIVQSSDLALIDDWAQVLDELEKLLGT